MGGLQGRLISGHLVVMRVWRSPVSRHLMYHCRCSCGREIDARGADFDRGRYTSCGCRKGYKHGMTYSPTWWSWRAMRVRCANPKHEQYPNYGGRGIRVCARWLDPTHGYEWFVEDMGERPLGATIDRIDVNGNYEPGNCRWATAIQQAFNKRRVRPAAEDQAEQAYWESRAAAEAGEAADAADRILGPE